VKAVILAAGKGTRMGGLTAGLPKPMLQVQGKPILEHILAGLISAGIRHFFIVTGFCGEVIENYFGDGKKWNVSITFGRQTVQDGTGKAPEVAKEFVGADDFVLTYGDILVPADAYREMLRRYGGGAYSGLVTCTGSEDVTKGGLFFFDHDFCLEKLVEKPTAAQLDQLRREGRLRPGETAWYNAGIYIFKPVLFDFTARLEKSPRGEYELTDALTGLLAAGHRLAGLEIPGRWVDVRDPQVLAALEQGEPPVQPGIPALSQSPFEAAIGKFDAENARDPNTEVCRGIPRPRELLYAERLTEWVLRLAPDAPEALRLAARCQHICRWMIPRQSQPMTRPGYLRWRAELKEFHAQTAARILRQAGYGDEIIEKVRDLNLKRNFPGDPESRVLEDALCLVFLEFQFAGLACKMEEDKMIRTVQKTWQKMTAAAQARALALPLGPKERALVQRALQPAPSTTSTTFT
jgi:dTDP-glucose pyrophosphorylase